MYVCKKIYGFRDGRPCTQNVCMYVFECMYVCKKSMVLGTAILALKMCVCWNVCMYVCIYVCIEWISLKHIGRICTQNVCMHVCVCVCMYASNGSVSSTLAVPALKMCVCMYVYIRMCVRMYASNGSVSSTLAVPALKRIFMNGRNKTMHYYQIFMRPVGKLLSYLLTSILATY